MNGWLPEMRTTDPNSPSERANPSAEPDRIAGKRFGKDDPPEGLEGRRAERRGRLFHLEVELEEHRLDGSDDERQRDEEQRER